MATKAPTTKQSQAMALYLGNETVTPALLELRERVALSRDPWGEFSREQRTQALALWRAKFDA